MLADLFDGLFLALIEDDLVLFEQVAALSVDGNDQGAKLVNVAVPQSFRHTEVTPLGLSLIHISLWPFSTLGWPNEESADLKYFYPTNTLVTGYDIDVYKRQQ